MAAAANDDEIFINHGRTGETNGLRGRGFASKPFAQVDASALSERGHRFAGGGIELVEKLHDSDKDSFVVAGRPVGQTAVGLRGMDAGIKFPKQGAGSGVECEYFLRGRNAVEDAVNNNWAGLQATFFAGIKAPCNLKLVHIAAIDLHETGVVVVFRCAAVDRPVAIVLREAGSGEEQCKCKERECSQFFTCAVCTEDIIALADSSNIHLSKRLSLRFFGHPRGMSRE